MGLVMVLDVESIEFGMKRGSEYSWECKGSDNNI